MNRGGIPPSPEQRRLWLVDRHEGGGPAYVAPVAWRIVGDLDVAAIAEAIDALVARHEGLHCVFAERDGDISLAVPPPPRDGLEVFNLPNGTDQAEATRAFLARPWDLAKGPLFRAALWRTPDESLLMLAMHHAVVDGWSISVLVNELAELYAAARAGAIAALPPAPTLMEIAAWRMSQIDEASLQHDLDYWRRQLDGAPAELSLPADRERPASPDWSGRTVRSIPEAVTAAAIAEVASAHRTTPFAVTIAAIAAFLSRWCNQEDFVVGVPFTALRDGVLQRAVAFLVNTLPIRVNTTGDPTFSELVSRIAATTTDAFLHQDAPLDAILAAIGADRVPGVHPLFQVVVTYQNVPHADLRLGAATVRFAPVDIPAAKFDLLVDVTTEEDRLALRWEFREDLFDAPSVETASAMFDRLFGQCLADPATRLSELVMLTSQEVAAGYGLGPVAAASAVPVLAQIAARVREWPGVVAARCGEEAVTRSELWSAAECLATRLRAGGVRPEDLVAVHLPRSADLLTALLGIWMAGAVYVPLDPAQPAERKLHILSRSGATAYVGTAVPGADWATAIAVREPGDIRVVTPSTADGVPDRLAYVMYTSGSTGEPKGVMVEHGSLAGLVAEMASVIAPKPDDRMLASTTVTFDISLVELLVPLCAGIECLIADDEAAADPMALAAYVRQYDATIVQATPSVWRVMAKELGAVRVALSGGEALPRDVREAISRIAMRAYNVYGPTETTIWSAAAPLDPTSRDVPVGRALGNNHLVVLDRWGWPAPPGTSGELWIGGPAVARGYLGDPDLTAERFRKLQRLGGGRYYRTGDQARLARDGRFFVTGRLDEQLKLRGFRVEPAEVEAVLRMGPGITDSAVVSVHSNDNVGLVAFVVPSVEARTDPGQAVGDWRQQWDDVYSDGPDQEFAGWINSLSQRPYPYQVMVEWAEHAVRLLGAVSGRRVLEIGAGSGIVTRRAARDSAEWMATDVSPNAVRRLRALSREYGLPVTAIEAGAHELNALTGAFDIIVLNSVVQYFPNAEYLDTVLSGCLDRLADGGRLVLGDLRSLPLAAAQYAAAAQRRGPQADPVRHRHLVTQLTDSERELLVDPRYLPSLLRNRPEYAVFVGAKPLRRWSEMAAFRYDAVVTRRAVARPSAPELDLMWDSDVGSLGGLSRILATSREVVVRAVPDERSARWLVPPPPDPIPPAYLTQLASDRELSAVLGVDLVAPDRLAVYFSANPQTALRRAEYDAAQVTAGPSASLVRSPRAPTRLDVGRLEEVAAAQLPAYMVPNRFVVVPRLPLLPSGKVDRGALRVLARDHLAHDAVPLEPADEIEASVRQAWSRLLGHSGFGADQSFFRAGGDSLGGVRLLAELRRELGVDLRLPDLLRTPTFRPFCDMVRRALTKGTDDTAA